MVVILNMGKEPSDQVLAAAEPGARIQVLLPLSRCRSAAQPGGARGLRGSSMDARHSSPDPPSLDDDRDATGEFTREQRRSRRKRAVRARTISIKRLTRRELELTPPITDEAVDRPRSRAECAQGPRPCPYISCKYHLYLDVSPRTGSIKLNFPDLEVWELPVTCALDIADAGGSTLEDVGAIMNLTRERIRQLEVRALTKLEAVRDMLDLRERAEPGGNDPSNQSED